MIEPHNLIVIPARYASTRFPGKPLASIAGKTMLQRVCEVALTASQQLSNTYVIVSSDDERILEHASTLNVGTALTSTDCQSGSDRLLETIAQLPSPPSHVLNLQGDAPLTPAHIVIQLLRTINTNENIQVLTPILKLTWEALDILRAAKTTQPFSGTTAIIKSTQQALWFSKNIIPAIRNEAALRKQSIYSPIYQHIGLYAYSYATLQQFSNLPIGIYERLEGLEQLRFLENDIPIQTLEIENSQAPVWRGIDTPEDAVFIEQYLLNNTEAMIS